MSCFLTSTSCSFELRINVKVGSRGLRWFHPLFLYIVYKRRALDISVQAKCESCKVGADFPDLKMGFTFQSFPLPLQIGWL